MNFMLISSLQGKSQSYGQGKVKESPANRVITCLYTYDEFMPTVLFMHTYSSRKQILWTVTMVHVLTALHFQFGPRWAHSNGIPSVSLQDSYIARSPTATADQ